jgi:hypothetical protein
MNTSTPSVVATEDATKIPTATTTTCTTNIDALIETATTTTTTTIATTSASFETIVAADDELGALSRRFIDNFDV